MAEARGGSRAGFPHASAVQGRRSALASGRGGGDGDHAGGRAPAPDAATSRSPRRRRCSRCGARAAGRRRARGGAAGAGAGGGGARRPRRGGAAARRRRAGGGDREAASRADGARARPGGDRAPRGAGRGRAATASTPSSPTIAAEAGASVIYVVGRDGIAIAASNAGTPDSFVGSDYAFRTYFIRAMAEGAAQQYALGTVSRRPGLYLSRRVDSVLGPLGVVVDKVELDDLEARWRESGLVVVVTDADGVVLATTEPGWRFGTTRPLADAAAAARRCRWATPRSPRCPSPWARTGRPGSTAASTSPPALPSVPRRPDGGSPCSCRPSRR